MGFENSVTHHLRATFFIQKNKGAALNLLHKSQWAIREHSSTIRVHCLHYGKQHSPVRAKGSYYTIMKEDKN